MSTLGGAVCIRNGDKLDFPWRECVQSLLPVCDEVCLCVATGNEDNTEQDARDWAEVEPKINLCMYPWPEPRGDPDFWVKWLNYAREHLRADWHFQLDADEILHEKSYDEVRKFIEGDRKSAIVTRWNFWSDHRHTIPEGYCCGKHVIRLAPTNLWMASDGFHENGAEVVNLCTATGIEIFHYGFIRRREAFFDKERRLQGYFFDTYDPRLQTAESFAGNWMAMGGVTGWEDKLDDYTGDHPQAAKSWLKARGYDV